ncbi:MAG TPA: sodium:proton antiporter, partial [Tissierellia bacterium]|nr:sodium:proton antiporter [Tissierellia bacterium]
MEQRKVSPLISLIPIIFLIALLYVSVVVYEIDVHIPIFISAMFATLIGVFVLKTPWEVIEEGIFETIKLSLIAI